MFINGVDLKNYKAKLVSLNIGTAAKSCERKFLSRSSLKPVLTGETGYQFTPISLDIEIIASNRNEFEQLKSSLIAALRECVIKFEDIKDRIYTCYMPESAEIVKEELPETGEITCTLYAICEGPEQEKTFTKTLQFKVEGNCDVAVVLAITNNIALNDITITGLSDKAIKVSSVERNTPLVIDGNKCTITQGGSNKFKDAEMWEFPHLLPGTHTVTLSTEVTSATLSYKPRFI